MALSLRLRRALTLSSSLLNRHLSPISPSPASLIPYPNPNSLIRPRLFRSSPSSSFSSSFGRRSDGGFEDSKIGPDEILFEGCDYNHWLITVDFPKGDSRPTPEQMVETYVQTAAQVFGSVEEAKRRIYACSTTTYDGFQVVCDEATSEKFRGLPGVVFILPDSYIDPTNKQYGGDKYDNGVITPRPPPIQYGRQRYGDRNRNDRPRGSMPPQQGTETRGYNYGSPRQDRNGYGQGDRRDYAQAGGQVPPQSGFPQGQQGNPPPFQSGFTQGQQGNPPPFQTGFTQGQQGNPPPFQTGFPQGQQGNPPPFQTGFSQGQQGNPPPFQTGFPQCQQGNPPLFETGFSQSQQGNPPRQEQMNYSQGPRGDNRSGPAPGYSGNYGQGSGPAEQRQPSPGYGGNYGQGYGTSGQFGQDPGSGYNNDYRR